MELKVLVKVALVLFLVGFAANTVDARFDSLSLITEKVPNGNGGGNYPVKSTAAACCDFCTCTKSIPPQCQCEDVRRDGCHGGCQNCINILTYPPQYICADITDFCYPLCDSKAH